MRRKEYRNRQPVTLSVEKDRWKDFEELCDKERKSVSLKIAEMLEEELEKKALGGQNPINISYGKQQEKPFQSDLTAWFGHVDTVNEHQELNKLKGQALALCKRVDKRSMELYRNGIKS